MVALVKPLGTAPDVVPLVAFVPSAARLPPGKFKYNNSVPVGGKFVDPSTIESVAATTTEVLVASNARAVGCATVTAGAVVCRQHVRRISHYRVGNLEEHCWPQ